MRLEDEAEALSRELGNLGRLIAEALVGIPRLVYWLDRQLRRSPRLYAWLSR